MSEHNYEAGGRVQISGKWYKMNRFLLVQVEPERQMEVEKLEPFIQDYEPPKKEVVHEWIDSDLWGKAWTVFVNQGNGFVQDVLNKELTELYGAPPIVRTYNGEKAKKFGMKDDDCVLSWGEQCKKWDASYFDCLDKGEKWVLQPPAPKEDE